MYELLRESFWEKKLIQGVFIHVSLPPPPPVREVFFFFAVNNFFKRDRQFEKWSGALSKSRAVFLKKMINLIKK